MFNFVSFAGRATGHDRARKSNRLELKGGRKGGAGPQAIQHAEEFITESNP